MGRVFTDIAVVTYELDAHAVEVAQQVRVEFQLLADTLADLFLSDRQCAHELIVQVYA